MLKSIPERQIKTQGIVSTSVSTCPTKMFSEFYVQKISYPSLLHITIKPTTLATGGTVIGFPVYGTEMAKPISTLNLAQPKSMGPISHARALL